MSKSSFPPNVCPACHADLTEKEIPAEHRQYYGDATHFVRTIGIYAFDRTIAWKCPDCEHTWPREGNEHYYMRFFPAEVQR